MRRIGLCVLVFLAAFTLTASSQEQGAGTPQQKKIIKKVPMKQTAASSGEEMYREYCAVCHGKVGKGDGPAASEFKVPPPDLTTLAKNNNGKFPSDRVAAVLRLGTPAPAHGTSDMPVWGRLLGTSPIHGTESTQVQLRIHNLTTYIESLQVK
jgi:mono/diheme cytochrome c family protein